MEEDRFYAGVYRATQDNGLSGWYIKKSHLSLEKLPVSKIKGRILEVGGNVGEHIKYVDNGFSSYTLTDYRDTKFSSSDNRVQFKVADVENLPFGDKSFDRVISTCLLHHLANPELALSEMRRVVKVGGVISILIPCDPGLLYRLAKRLGARRKWKDHGIRNPEYFHYTQHRNHFPALHEYLLENYYADIVKWRTWPIPLRTWNLNLYFVYQIIKSD